ncbi:MAG TPA: hypothetical protein DEB40_12410 [Elusimicrobia bacterium]|nr:hypothetical protein [Elusimicrobiota bacterium]HBT62537.1 hypothetical protein [Elusimicrobiota bacterium]
MGMKTIHLAVALALCPISAAAFPMSLDQFPQAQSSINDFKNKLAPAAVDRKVVDRLFENLAMNGSQFAKVEPGSEKWVGPSHELTQKNKNGSTKTLRVTLIESNDQKLAAQSKQGLVSAYALHRRSFIALTGFEETVAPLPSGNETVEQYEYTVSLDGELLAVKHSSWVRSGRNSEKPGKNPAISMVERLPPQDPAVLKRWKKVSSEFLRMGPTVKI